MTENNRTWKCPMCREPMAVVDSRPSRGGIRRTRRCMGPTCRHRITTYEFTPSNPATVVATLRRVDELVELLNTELDGLRRLYPDYAIRHPAMRLQQENANGTEA